MNIASIDSGTNTVLLLIAERIGKNSIKPLFELHNMPRVGEDVVRTGIIKEEKILELCRIYKEYKLKCDEYNVEKIIACGTNVYRIAINTPEAIERVKEASGIEMQIISGDYEAESSFMGATADFNRDEKITVIDIGGGSSEVTCKDSGEILFKKSFSTGVISLREQFLKDNSMLKENILQLEDFCQNYFQELEKIRGASDYSIAIAGTPSTLYSLRHDFTEFNREKVHKKRLSIDDIDVILSKLIDLPFDEYSKFGKIIKGREDLIGAGAIVLKSIISKLGLKETFVSTTGLRYGLILKYLENNYQ
jgi:exopolyphosphatase/guanosine-5'-triphosphate,3'-diphosphate pyrophosphatase